MHKHYHFIGIGGIGMGTLASLLLAKGFKVRGSDLKESPMLARLREEGATVLLGHDARHIDDADCVVYSSAVKDDNPEMLAAREKGLPVIKRAKLLAQLMEKHIGITVAGAHGKTTTASMISHLLIRAGLNPTTAVGGIHRGGSYNAKLGAGQYFVAEVDESDGSFLLFKPMYSVITNIDYEHLDYYGDWKNILSAYQKFIGQTESQGLVIACAEDKRLKRLVKDASVNALFYGFSRTNDVYAENIRMQGCMTKFDCFFKKKRLGPVQLIVPGEHNVLNAMATLGVGLKLSIEFSLMQEAFRTFEGVNRRFQIKGRFGDIIVVDDYGHHPSEIAATLKTAKSLGRRRVITVFQPHRYTRTKFLFEQFIESLSLSDYLIITDIYAASEPAIEGVSSQRLCERLSQGKQEQVIYLPKDKILAHLLRVVRPGDLVLTLGAGDINRIGDEFLAAVSRQPVKGKTWER